MDAMEKSEIRRIVSSGYSLTGALSIFLIALGCKNLSKAKGLVYQPINHDLTLIVNAHEEISELGGFKLDPFSFVVTYHGLIAAYVPPLVRIEAGRDAWREVAYYANLSETDLRQALIECLERKGKL